MKYVVYAVFDTATETYMSPFFMKTEAEALRGFRDAASNPETPLGQHPADYHLFRIGEYTDHNGDLRSQPPECIISALEAASAARQDSDHPKD